MLQSLIDLYVDKASTHAIGDENAANNSRDGGDAHDRTSIVVQLAKRRLAIVQKEVARQREAQLAEIRNRLDAAANLKDRDPQKAAAMYRAIADLYDEEPWAADAVAEARNHLEALQTTND
jgi:hypothetical protein